MDVKIECAGKQYRNTYLKRTFNVILWEKKTEGNYRREPYPYREATQVQGGLVSRSTFGLPVTNSILRGSDSPWRLEFESVDLDNTLKMVRSVLPFLCRTDPFVGMHWTW